MTPQIICETILLWKGFLMFKRYNELSEDYFSALRRRFELHQQSPRALGRALVGSSIAHAFFCLFSIFILTDGWDHPLVTRIFLIHVVVTSVQFYFSLFYSIPYVNRMRQKMQYFFVITTLLLIGISFYLIPLYIVADEVLFGYHSHSYYVTEETFIRFIQLSLIVGVMIMIVGFLRFNYLLTNGKFREGSDLDLKRQTTEESATDYIRTILIIVVGIGIIALTMAKYLEVAQLDRLLIASFGILVFYYVLYKLPVQLCILYCKRRFKSFNFDAEGNIYPVGSGDRQKSA